MIDKNSEGEVFIMDFATHGAEGPMLPFWKKNHRKNYKLVILRK
jgi:hypothetical protein